MKKFVQLALALAATAATVSAGAAPVAYEKNKPVNDNWGNGTSEYVWKNGTDELCWRDGNWTPATANAKCDGALVAQQRQPEVTPPPQLEGRPQLKRFTLAADALFDFDKAVLKPAGKTALSDLATKIKDAPVDAIAITGHTDSFGSDAYNNRLSLRRAEAVKAHLVSQGVAANKITVDGRGKRDLKIDPKSCKGKRKAQIACQQPNRRVEVELTGTRTEMPGQ